MQYQYLSITSSILVVLGYLPEIYSVIINKKSNITNIPIWIRNNLLCSKSKLFNND
jgi:hypothetical protein